MFKEKIEEKSINLEIGEIYIISLIHALGKDGRMRLRFKTIIKADKFKNRFFKHFMIHLDNIDFIDDIKEKLLELEQGNKKVLIIIKILKFLWFKHKLRSKPSEYYEKYKRLKI